MMLAKLLKECGAVMFGDFTLTSGKKSKYYVDIKKASTEPKILREIAKEIKNKLPKGTERLAGLELGAVPIVVAVSLETDLPYVIIRKGERTHGTGKLIEGMLKEGEKVVLIEDVTTTGGSSIKSIEILRNAGAKVEDVITVVDREEGAKESINQKGGKLIPLLRISEIMEEK
ncbi:MAG: orotate phosphoribosyltransferase [Thermoplasmata archaeon]